MNVSFKGWRAQCALPLLFVELNYLGFALGDNFLNDIQQVQKYSKAATATKEGIQKEQTKIIGSEIK